MSQPLTDQEHQAARAVLRLATEMAGDPQQRPDRNATRQARRWGELVDRLPAEAVRRSLEAVLLGDNVQQTLQWLHDVGVLKCVLPEIDATVDFTQEHGRHHKDVWKHTKQVVEQSEREPVIRWAALLHDVGKVRTRGYGPGGKVTFHGHAELGGRMFDRIGRRLAFPKIQRKQIKFLIQHHLRANQYDGSWTDSAVRRFDREMGDHLPRLVSLSRADITSARQHKRRAARAQLDHLMSRVEALRELDARVPPLPSGLGNLLMAHFELEPGRIIGTMREALEAAVEAEEIEAQREPEYYIQHLEKTGFFENQ